MTSFVAIFSEIQTACDYNFFLLHWRRLQLNIRNVFEHSYDKWLGSKNIRVEKKEYLQSMYKFRIDHIDMIRSWCVPLFSFCCYLAFFVTTICIARWFRCISDTDDDDDVDHDRVHKQFSVINLGINFYMG